MKKKTNTAHDLAQRITKTEKEIKTHHKSIFMLKSEYEYDFNSMLDEFTQEVVSIESIFESATDELDKFRQKDDKILTKKPVTLKDLFVNDELYEKTIQLLIDRNRIRKVGSGHKIVCDLNKDNISIISLMYVLKNRDYLKKSSGSEMCRIAGDFFDNKITRQQFNRVLKAMDEPIKYKSFIQDYFFIPKS